MNKITLVFLLVIAQAFAQSEDEKQIRQIYDVALTDGEAYNWLNYLSNQIGGRLSGSVQAQQAVDYTKSQMDLLGLDRVWLQPVMVPKWVRGTPEFAYMETDPGVTTNVPICALGGSIPTYGRGVKANVIEVQSIEELKTLGKEKISGKIVFFNRPMNPAAVNTFDAYSGAVDQRGRGAAEAGKYEALGVIVRSMNLRQDDYPHAGGMNYGDITEAEKVPAAAISTNGADLLSATLKLNPNIQFFFKLNCKTLEDVESYNVIGEIKGSTHPDEIMVVGGHLDSWDLGDGSHDDGAGCVQSMEVLRILKKTGYKPKRTIRAVLFMNEENGFRGGKKYAELAKDKKENHVFGLESDSGGFTPRGFSFDASEANLKQAQSWAKLFEPYFVHMFIKGYAGADINPLKNDAIVLAGLRPDSQRYFDHHHAENDTFEHVNRRELELGAGAMASLVYLFDKYGVVSSK